MYKLFLHSHVVTSSLFLIFALWISFRSLLRINKDTPFGRRSQILEYIYLGLIYITLIQGIILYFFLRNDALMQLETYAEVQANAASRFWAIEHSAVMIFVLIMSQIGKFFTSQQISNIQKHRYAAFYYGTATLATILSVSFLMASKL